MADEFFTALETLHGDGSSEPTGGNPNPQPGSVEGNTGGNQPPAGPQPQPQPQQPQPQAGGQGDQGQPGAETPRLFAGKYKTPEELEQAYTNSNKESSRMAQELAQYRRYFQGIQAQQQRQQSQQDPEQANREFLNNFARDPIGTMQKVMQQGIQPVMQTVQGQQYDRTIQVMESAPDKFPGFTELKPVMADLLEANPWLWNADNPIHAAYNMALANNMGKFVEQAVQKATGLQQQNAGMVQQAQTVPAGQAKPPRVGQQQLTIQDTIRQGILNVKDPVSDFINS